MLLFKDAIRLFAAYNEGIINLLGKYNCFAFLGRELRKQTQRAALFWEVEIM